MTIKTGLLKFISRWNWGYRLTEAEYWRTLIQRERRKTWRLNKVIRIARERADRLNLKHYVIPLPAGGYWYGTGKEWTIDKKKHRGCSRIWLVSDAVWQYTPNERNIIERKKGTVK